MIYHAPTIFQILEGEEEEVQKLFNVIKKDKRHQIISYHTETIVHHSFPHWKMAYKKLSIEEIKKNLTLEKFFYQKETDLDEVNDTIAIFVNLLEMVE